MLMRPARRRWAARCTALAALALLAAASEPATPQDAAAERYAAAALILEQVSWPSDYNIAAENLEAAVLLDPDWAEPFYTLGLVYAKQGRYAEAAESLRTYLELKPGARDFAAVTGMIAVLDAKALRGIDRALVVEALTTLDDAALWRRTSGDERAQDFIPLFRETPGGLVMAARVDAESQARKDHAVDLAADRKSLQAEFDLAKFQPPAPGYSCGGEALCNYRVKVDVVLDGPGLVEIELSFTALYDAGPLLDAKPHYFYFKP